MVDDNIKLEALPLPHIIKAIVTSQQPIDLERNDKQSYQDDIFVRFMDFGNEVIKIDSNCSEGFLRRQLVLSARERTDQPGGRPLPSQKTSGL